MFQLPLEKLSGVFCRCHVGHGLEVGRSEDRPTNDKLGGCGGRETTAQQLATAQQEATAQQLGHQRFLRAGVL